MSTSAIQHQGKSFPLGATLSRGGANFSVFAKHGRAAQLLLFDRVDDPEPLRVIDLDPRINRTYHYWHAFVPGVAAGQLYGYRVSGPFDPARGLRFDPNKVLLDPYGKCIARPVGRSREAARKLGDNAATALRSVVVDPSTYDWEGDTPLGRPFAKTIIYEMHVGGFTRHPSSGVTPSKRGTYAGLIIGIVGQSAKADGGTALVALCGVVVDGQGQRNRGTRAWVSRNIVCAIRAVATHHIASTSPTGRGFAAVIQRSPDRARPGLL